MSLPFPVVYDADVVAGALVTILDHEAPLRMKATC